MNNELEKQTEEIANAIELLAQKKENIDLIAYKNALEYFAKNWLIYSEKLREYILLSIPFDLEEELWQVAYNTYKNLNNYVNGLKTYGIIEDDMNTVIDKRNYYGKLVRYFKKKGFEEVPVKKRGEVIQFKYNVKRLKTEIEEKYGDRKR